MKIFAVNVKEWPPQETVIVEAVSHEDAIEKAKIFDPDIGEAITDDILCLELQPPFQLGKTLNFG
jgi:hypothetical protein